MKGPFERPRIGVPWRTANEESANNRPKIDKYLYAVERAGGEPILLSLTISAEELRRTAAELDAFVLTGSPADVNPALFHAARHPATDEADADRERTDFTLIEHALSASKPLLAICYGIQSLNVYLGGNLVQDIPTCIASAILHSPVEDDSPGGPRPPELFHDAQFEAGTIRDLAGAPGARVNSSHHQSILEPGRGLRITGRAADGVVEAVEWTSDSNWIVGVQWHPERMPEDPFAQALFQNLVHAGRRVLTAK
jgi:putative glutamine amidotransferase